MAVAEGEIRRVEVGEGAVRIRTLRNVEFELPAVAPKHKAPKLLISAITGRIDQRDLVFSFEKTLVANGFETAATVSDLDDSAEPRVSRWVENQIQDADFVLLVCTGTYPTGERGQEEQGSGSGVPRQWKLILDRIYRDDQSLSRLIPILLPGSDPSAIPEPLRRFDYYAIGAFNPDDPGYQGLLLHLTGQPPSPSGDAPPPQAPSPDQLLQMVRIRRLPEPVTYRDDPNERHGLFVGTRGAHSLHLPEEFAVGRYLVTNATFLEFVREGGYRRDDFWDGAHYAGFLCGDGLSRGPASWPSDRGPGPEQRHHPVTRISFVEALAFCRWLQQTKPDLLVERGWRWELPKEDMWEYVARTDKGLRYPWGNEFKPDHCNSAEQKLGTTSEVTRFPRGRSSVPGAPDVEGCYDMAGNVWEFVLAQDTRFGFCVLRGGSYRNTQAGVRSYLRLHGVPSYNRDPDFGFRFAQYPEQAN